MTKFSLLHTGIRRLADCHGKSHLQKKTIKIFQMNQIKQILIRRE